MEIIIPLNEAPVAHHREECNEQLTITTRPAPDNPTHKLLSATNHAYDTASKIVYAFDAAVPMQALGSTVASTRTDPTTHRLLNVFATTVNPMQRVELFRGPFVEHASRSISAGTPDPSFFAERAAHAEAAVDARLAQVRAAVRQMQQQHASSPQGNSAMPPALSSEFVAQLCSRSNIPFVDLGFAPKKATALLRDCDTGTLGSGSNPIIFLRPDEALRGTAKLRASVPPPALFSTGSRGSGDGFHEAASYDVRPANVCQGTLGDCYFCCTMACLAAHPRLVLDAFSPVQEPSKGIYRVLMCKHGWWQCVVVDDYLPTQSGRLCFTRNKPHPTQLWVPVLEKAYAKAHGSYAAIRAGDAPLAMMDLTGCPYVHLNKLPEFDDKDRLFEVLRGGIAKGDIVVTVGTPSKATMDADAFAAKSKAYDACGLTMDHAYSVLEAVLLRGSGSGPPVRLLRLRDPWGGGAGGSSKSKPKAWSGAYAAGDAAWTPALQSQLAAYRNAQAWSDAPDAEDGNCTFWMAWEDCVRYFDNGALCRIDVRDHKQLRVQGLMAPTGWCSASLCFRVVHQQQPERSGGSETPSLSCSFGAHQKDRRSIPPTSATNPSGTKTTKPPPPYLGLLLSVLVVNVKTMKTVRVVANSNPQGTFGNYRDVFSPALQLAPNAADECYVVVVQSLVVSDPAAADRPLVLSAIWDAPEALCADIRIRALRPPSELLKGTSTTAPFMPPLSFQPMNYSDVAEGACWQARMRYPGREGMLVVSRTGGTVDPNIFSTENKQPKPTLQATVPAGPTTGDGAATEAGRHHVDPHLSTTSADATSDAIDCPIPRQEEERTTTPASMTDAAVDRPPASHMHVLLLDAVLEAPSLPIPATSPGVVVAVHIRLVRTPPRANGERGGGRQPSSEGQQEVGKDASGHDAFVSRRVLLERQQPTDAEHPAVDGVVKDTARSTDGGVLDPTAQQAWRAVWCEGTRLPIMDDVACLDQYRLDAQLVAADHQPGVATSTTYCLASGRMSLQPRDVRRGGSGQMVTIVLRHDEPCKNEQRLVDDAVQEVAAGEVGEVHVGLSWV